MTIATNHPLLLRAGRRVGHAGPVDVLLRDGRVAALGPDLRDAAGPRVEVVELDGRHVLPGLWDAHVHLTQWALARQRLDVSRAASAAEAVALVRARLDTAPPAPGAPLVGFGFRDGLWPDDPTTALLDAAVGEVPVVLVSGDLHCAWLSTAGLRMLGVGAHDGGLLREGDWMPLQGAVDHVPDDVADAAVHDAALAAAARGVVGVVDLEIADNLDVWRRRTAARPGVLRVRAGVWEEHLDRVVRDDLHTGDRVAGLVEQGPLKVITDGSLNTRTAYCHDPYPGTSDRGVLSVPPERLVPLMTYARSHGLRCAVHAIGDAANALALDAFAASGAAGSVEHAQLLDDDDVQRFAELGVVASVQPEHAMDDRDVADHHWAGRTRRAFPLAALHAAGVTLTLGSDAPVAPLDPWVAVDAAVWRSRDGRDAWHQEQRLDLLTALAASVDGRPLGLQVGDPADLVLLDDDPVARGGAAGALRDMPVAGTLVAGGWTYLTL
ncbi:amidohydrolase family protein [Cellulomonas sp. H30R-01]|uniref:amidohydrolase n=1 Tax=Cellulomonas sp. H30R-01 TaxID=2704467 RepID=UPI00138CF48D|nr:amidohydrolase family protein [Cellulomonas sp. H30R-01]QHT56970.1 amidohydrolase family protein [Cellulomonas sp. H30R-01]